MKSFKTARNAVIVFIFGTVMFTLSICAINYFAGKPYLTRNDLHLLWVMHGKNYFVNDKTPSGFLLTNPELQVNHNGLEKFSKIKGANTFRIFCIGGSTTRGWPFHEVFSYPKLLSFMIGDTLKDRKVEVINAGFHASDSFSDLPLVEEVMNYQPDVLIINEGGNDIWDFPLHYSKKSGVIKIHCWLLRNVYLYSYIFHFGGGRIFDHAAAVRQLMEKGTEFDERIFKAHYLSNLGKMLYMCNKGGCKMILLNQLVFPNDEREGRPSSKLNGFLREFSKEHQVLLVDVKGAFDKIGLSKEGIIIPPPSLHPDRLGYCIIARELLKALCENEIIGRGDEWNMHGLKNDEQYLKQCGANDKYLGLIYAELSKFFMDVGDKETAKHYNNISQRFMPWQ